jgi:hypothetical protein
MQLFVSYIIPFCTTLSLRSDSQTLENIKTGTAREHSCENGSPRESNTSAGRKNEGDKIYSSLVFGASRVKTRNAYRSKISR